MATRIDGHQHFWSLKRGDYDWLTPSLAPLYWDFQPEDLKPLLDQAGINKTIVVQAASTVEETRYLLQLADSHDFIAGVVGWVDMESNGVVTVLEELSQHPKFVGVRPMIENIKDPAWMNQTKLEPAFQCLIENNLCFDALVKSIHLPHLATLLSRHPELQTVIDHGAKPDIAAGAWQPWADQLSIIAGTTSAYCKVSGLITEAAVSQSYEDLTPYLDHLLGIFGPERLIWGSDWPVLKMAGDYLGWHNAFQKWVSQLSEFEQTLIEGSNATRFYGLEGM